jgi:hypothetical protein
MGAQPSIGNSHTATVFTMFKQIRPCLVLLALAVPSLAWSAEYRTGAIEKIYPADDDSATVYFRLVGDTCNDAGANEYYYFTSSRKGAKNWYALLLTAVATGKSVTVRVDACTRENKSVGYILMDP